MRPFAGFAAAVVLGGCAQISGLGDYGVTDTSPDAGGHSLHDAAADATTRPLDGSSGEDVTAETSDDAASELGDATEPEDATPDAVAAEAGAAFDAGSDATGGVEAGCASSLLTCDGGCLDPSSVSSCGSCGSVCSGATPVCATSGATYACASGCPDATPTLCNGTCVDEKSNPNACGGCGAAYVCSSGQTCSDGSCFGCGASCPTSAASTFSCVAGGCNAAAGACTSAGAGCYCTSNAQCASGECAKVTGQNDVSCGSSCATTTAAHDAFDCVLASPGIPAACGVSAFGYVPSNVATASTPMATLAANAPSAGTTVSSSFTYQSPSANGLANANGGTWSSGVPPYVYVYQAQASGGPNVDILVFQSLTVNSGVTLTIGGLRPVIFLVFGSASIAGTISADGHTGAVNTFGTDMATPLDNPANVANVYDNNAATTWTSDTFASANNTEWLAYWWPSVPFQTTRPTSYLYVTPHYSGSAALGFPTTFTIYYSNPSSWVSATTFTNYHVPTGTGPVVLPLGATYLANGIQLVASTLGADGAHYDLSLAEARAGAAPSGPGGDYGCGSSTGGNGNDANSSAPYDRNTGGGGGGASGAGGSGGNDGSGGGGAAGAARANTSIVPLYGGCPGGISGTCGGTQFGGGGGGAVQISAAGTLTVTGTVSAVGGAGGTSSNQTCNGSAYVGGAGGGSGGAVLLEGSSVSAPPANTPVTGGTGGTTQSTAGGSGGTGATPTGGNGAHGGTGGSGGGGGYGYLKINNGAAPTYACMTTLSPAPACTGGSTCLCVADSDCPSGSCSNAGGQCTGTCSGSTAAGAYDSVDCALASSAATAWSCSAGACSNVASPGGGCSSAGVACWCTADSQCPAGTCVTWAGCTSGACTGAGTPDGFHCAP